MHVEDQIIAGIEPPGHACGFHQNRRIVKTASVAQVRKPIYRSSVARWRPYEAHLGPLFDVVKGYR